jgi:hypothetical protein
VVIVSVRDGVDMVLVYVCGGVGGMVTNEYQRCCADAKTPLTDL